MRQSYPQQTFQKGRDARIVVAADHHTRSAAHSTAALSLPCGFTSDGLPIGLQIVGARFGETTVLRLGHAYHLATNGHTRRPALLTPPAAPAV